MPESSSPVYGFRYSAQLALEATFPAALTLPGYADPIIAAGGSLKKSGARAILGGIVGDYAAAFRVRAELLTRGIPEVGSTLTFAGLPWRIDRTNQTPNDPAVFIGVNYPSKA